MDEELRSYLGGMETRLGESSAAMEARLRTHVDEAISASEVRCRAHTEVVETRLLNEFGKWARTADAGYRQHQTVVGGLDIRVQTIEDRLAELERRPS